MDNAEKARLIGLAEERATSEVAAELGSDWFDEMYRELQAGDDVKYDHLNAMVESRTMQLLNEWGAVPARL